MSTGVYIEHRVKDVLFALYVAGGQQRQLGRLALQKFIYLFDVFAIVWRDVGANSKFKPWRNGPYDLSIQNAVDVLAFRGLVNIESLSFRKLRNAESKYTLANSGVDCVESLRKNISFNDDFQLFEAIGGEVQKRGWDNIKEIVYAEPTYGVARAAKIPHVLPVGESRSNLSAQILRDLKRALEVDRELPISRITLIQLMFAILDEYRTFPEAK